MVAVAVLLPLAALVVVVAPCIPTQGPDDDEWWDELSPTTSMLLKYSTTPVNELTSTVYVTPLPTTAEATSTTTTNPVTTSSTTSTTTTTSTTSTTTTTGMCPTAAWVYYAANNFCYIALADPMGDPELRCQNANPAAHKASILDLAENQFVSRVSNNPADPSVLSSWSWSDMSTYSWTHWDNMMGNTYPESIGAPWTCMLISNMLSGYTNGYWFNAACNAGAYGVVCKMPAA